MPSYGSTGWQETHERWHKEGLPEDIRLGDEYCKFEKLRCGENFYKNLYLIWTVRHFADYCKLDRLEQFNPGLRRGIVLYPLFPSKVLEEDEKYRIEINSDGNLNELIPLWLKGGANAFFPLEVTAGNDAVDLRKRYGKDIILFGNIDKKKMAKGGKELEREIMEKVPYLISTGGYFTHPDHDIPPDVSWENFQYYLKLLRKLEKGNR